MPRFIPILCFSLFVLLLGLSCKPNLKPVSVDLKIKGLSFASIDRIANGSDFLPIKELSAEWISLMPYAFYLSQKKELYFDDEFQWEGEKSEGIREMCKTARYHQLNVMLKPHIWYDHGLYTGELSFETEADWKKFESRYTDFILLYAKIAEDEQVDLFCIGNELYQFASERNEYWISLIDTVKKVYTGKITYAENWDKYSYINFWEQLDFIGVNGYFPISKQKNPDLFEMIEGWNNWEHELESFSTELQKSILFTELGYRSVDYTGKEPWNHQKQEKQNLDLQALAFEAFFESVWKKSWCAGVFIWKHYPRDYYNAENTTDYSIDKKPAANTILKYFKGEHK